MMNTITDIHPQIVNSSTKSRRVGEALLRLGKIKEEDMGRIAAKQEESNLLFGEAAILLGLISEKELKKALSEQFEYDYVDGQNKLSHKIFAAYSPFCSEVEKLRSLREYLLMHWFDLGNKSLAVVSSSEEDSACELVANLAIVFSQLNRKTLLIDSNLRNSKQQYLFGVHEKQGLSNILANKEGKYELSSLQDFPNLSVLTAGTLAPNPQELLNREGFANLIADLQRVYEVILIDSCPAQYGADYLAVAKQTRAALVVTRQHHTPIQSLLQLKSQLAFANAQVIGCTIQGA
jgi:protein-tyrosine kinase